jgi:hypothetical protein
MRYTRLRRQIESGTLIGTHGTPFSGSADKIHEASTKRKRGTNIKKSSDGDTEDDEPLQRKGKVRGGANGKGEAGRRVNGGDKGRGKEKLVKVKEEQESDFSSTSSDFEDSEDEMPLAKLRKARLGQFHSSKPYSSLYSYPDANGTWTPITGANEIPISMTGFGHGMRTEWQNILPFRLDRNQFNDAGKSGRNGGWQNMEWRNFRDRWVERQG